jgi:drug/metabolite transporter (DMT)-like permease
LTGVVGITIYNVALNTGEISVSAGVANFLVNTAPVITALLAMILLKERLRIWGWIGILICVSGVTIIALSTRNGSHISAGALFVLLAARAASFLYLAPTVTLAIAWLWLGELPTWLALFGGILAITGVICVNVLGKVQTKIPGNKA